ncbi:hypothetical protein CRE_22943 [Caenorhabditis remanei]|uniref:Uncharacterized protein n=1 Tax=Caenorhabditis remanei TaxID=31234 RepID=E3MW76_CAERE|nr:hypothetical protein CRE_22943 [Caenorhabditis remanei]
MKIQIEKRQEFVIDVKLRKEQCGLYLQFLNIHKATAENECGELVYNFNTYACQITSDSFFLDPGTYFINFLDVVSLHHPLVTVDWVIRSPSPLTTVSMDFVIIPFKTAIQSVQEVVLKYGKSEKYENGNLIVYTYTNANCFLIMADNLYKWTHIRYNATLLSDKEGVYSGSMLKQTSWVPISPRTRSFVAFLNHIELGVSTSQIKLEYCLSSWFMKWLNWIDASIFSENFELAISI